MRFYARRRPATERARLLFPDICARALAAQPARRATARDHPAYDVTPQRPRAVRALLSKNRNGSRTEPCGTPILTADPDGLSPLMSTEFYHLGSHLKKKNRTLIGSLFLSVRSSFHPYVYQDPLSQKRVEASN
ncbi:hypothetical protein EVAR_24922_1 [Eumeta japonica]|uniref:Uncharacterized protein n=1 Tax=Eumeta variegata TaxID=151549 RepID=A0A4C1V5B0_EUMVA|nr:hypothetical protein EVAR_24922_1 [Eumeta japonica]